MQNSVHQELSCFVKANITEQIANAAKVGNTAMVVAKWG
jgi:hypothetical protein